MDYVISMLSFTSKYRIEPDVHSNTKWHSSEHLNPIVDHEHRKRHEEEDDSPHFWTKISTVEMLKTKKGKPYANVRAEDGSSFRIWHNKLQYCEEDLIPGKIIAVKLQSDNFGRSLAWDRNSLLSEDNLLKLQEELY